MLARRVSPPFWLACHQGRVRLHGAEGNDCQVGVGKPLSATTIGSAAFMIANSPIQGTQAEMARVRASCLHSLLEPQ